MDLFGTRIKVLCGYSGTVDATILAVWNDRVAHVVFDDGTDGFITAAEIV